ncbi:MAG TPA: hypothetical protein PLK12_02030 [Prolixibacteraceae bacterium]|nr:hypothetical protein [Prolixibacteraceae bacterium]
MKRQEIYTLIVSLLMGWMLFACEEDNLFAPEGAVLTFSTDTIQFDTIFTSIGSATQSFRVINPYSQRLKISSIRLAGGDQSFYRLNIDGEPVNEVSDVELLPFDSIYIFVEVTIDPNGVNQPLIVQDSVLFQVGDQWQDVDLLAWGQDFHLIKQEFLTTQTWTRDKPYLVYDYAVVDSGAVLTLEPGTRVFFHDTAGFYVLGNIQALGTFGEPILFSGDRLEELYSDVPDQWYGILLFPNENLSVFENVEIKMQRLDCRWEPWSTKVLPG